MRFRVLLARNCRLWEALFSGTSSWGRTYIICPLGTAGAPRSGGGGGGAVNGGSPAEEGPVPAEGTAEEVPAEEAPQAEEAAE